MPKGDYVSFKQKGREYTGYVLQEEEDALTLQLGLACVRVPLAEMDAAHTVLQSPPALVIDREALGLPAPYVPPPE